MNDRNWPTEKECVKEASFKFKLLYFFGCYKKHNLSYCCGIFCAYWRLRWWNPISLLYVLISLICCVFLAVFAIPVLWVNLLSNIGYEETYLDNHEESEVLDEPIQRPRPTNS